MDIGNELRVIEVEDLEFEALPVEVEMEDHPTPVIEATSD
jgi:hypothetical protein